MADEEHNMTRIACLRASAVDEYDHSVAIITHGLFETDRRTGCVERLGRS
jgi:hypothetical protein